MASEALLSTLAEAISSRTPLPAIEQSLTLDEAYRLQHQLTAKLCPDGAAGIKAGVTTAGAQKYFGVDQALIASLYPHTVLDDNCRVPFVSGRLLECEFAVTVDADGTPLSIAPAIELALAQFSRPDDMTAENLVLSNVGADGFILGAAQDWAPPYDEASVRLTREDELLNEVSMTDALGGPEHAVPWILEEANRRGFSLGADTLLLTGACGKVVPAEVGRYTADFGPFGQISFEIT